MAAAIITLETGLQIVSQLLTLLQNSASTGQPIDAGTWNDTLTARDAALSKLDSDIADSQGK